MITEYLRQKDISLIPRPEPSDSRYKCFNTGGVEIEVGEFLYGLVRMIKPDNIFETGTHRGISSSYMAQALKDNGHGRLTTIEISRDHIRTSQKRWDMIGVSDYVFVDKEYSIEYFLEYPADIMFLDSEPEYRFKELIRFFPELKYGGYAFIHDLHRHMQQIPNDEHGFAWPYGELPKQIIEWVQDGQLRPFHFPTPRGLTGFYKPTVNDYKWR